MKLRGSVQGMLTVLGAAFALYLSVRGLVWAGGTVDHPVVMVLVAFVYLAAVALTLAVDGTPAPALAQTDDTMMTTRRGGPTRLPLWACAAALVVALAMPTAVVYCVGDDSRTTSYGTWYVGAIGLLMTMVMVRRRPLVAWTGLVLLGVSTMIWIGPLAALTFGLVGSVMWVVAAQLLLLSMDRAARDAARLAQLQRTASAWRAAQLGRQRERRVQVQRALAVAGPILSRAIEKSGDLDDRERVEARIAEGQLRDELRGARLLDDGVRAELDAARRRGATVSVLDEGGLDGLTRTQLAQIRADLAAALRDAHSDRLFIRASTHPEVAVTVVGRSAAGRALTDEDSVDLWREIPRPSAAD
jgi:hypothetical protein